MKLQLNQIYLLDEELHSPYKMLIYPFKAAISPTLCLALKYTERIKYGGWNLILIPVETSRSERSSFNSLDAQAAIVELFHANIAELMK